MFKRIMALLTLFVFLGLQVVAFAGDQEQVKKADTDKHAAFEGQLVCLSCTLKKTEGARAQCTDFGHTHALKTADGKYVSFLPNKYAADLMKGEKYQDKDIKVSGTYFASANQLDVETFEVDGQKHGWCDHCKAMDGCAFKDK